MQQIDPATAILLVYLIAGGLLVRAGIAALFW